MKQTYQQDTPAYGQPADTLVAHKVIPIHSWRASTGTKVVFIPSTRSAALDIELSFDAGSSRDLQNKSGLAAVTAFSLVEGTTSTLNNNRILEKMHSLGGDYHVNLEQDRVKIMLSIANNNIYSANAINLLSDIISYPSLSKRGVEAAKQSLADYNTQNEKLTSVLLEQEFYASMYTKHPYKNPAYGNNVDLTNINAEDVSKFYNKYYVSGNLVITIIGNITRNKAKQISEILVANLPKNDRAEPIQDIDKPISIIDKSITFPAVETQILIGYPMAKITDADWISMLVGNYILGNNNLGSTLYQELQQKYRIGYSTTSSIIPMAAAGPLKIRIYTEHAKNNAAKMLAINILKDFVQVGPTNEAVEVAKKHIIGAFPLQFANDKEILQEVSKLAFYGLPLDYFDNFVNKVNLVTRDDIILAFQTKINLDGLTMVSIGNAAKQS